MLIKSIEFENFLVFDGVQSIEFDLGSSHNLTLILAPNNAGKTSVIRALKYLLYGETDEAALKRFANLRMLQRTAAQEIVECGVKARFVDGSRESTVRRWFSLEKNGAGIHDYIFLEAYVERIRHEDESDDIDPSREEATINAGLAGIMPPDIFDFFFFAGEDLSARLRQADSNLLEGIKRLLYQDEWERCKSTIAGVRKTTQSELRKLVQADQERDTESALMRKVESDLAKQTKARQKLIDEIEGFDKLWQAADRELTALHRKSNPEQGKQLVKRKANKELRKQQQATADSKARDVIGKGSPAVLLQNRFEGVRAIFHDLEKQHLLPPDYSERLLSDIQARESCICSRTIKKGTDEWRAIETLREACYQEAVSRSLYDLSKDLRKGVRTGLPEMADTVLAALRESRDNTKKLATEIGNLEHEIQQLENSYDPDVEALIEEQKKKRLAAERSKQGLPATLQNIESQIRMSKNVEQELRTKIRSKSKSKRGQIVFEADELNKKLEELTDDCLKSLMQSSKRYLADHVSDLYNEIVTDGSYAVIDDKTGLPGIERSGVSGLASGGGQDQALLLSFLIALSTLRRAVNEELRKIFKVKEATEQCFFMDSVFGQTDKNYRQAIAEALPQKMPQLCVLVANQQWDEYVAAGLEEHLTATYGFVLHTHKESDKERCIFELFGKRVSLYSRLPSDIEPHTVITKL